MKAFLYCRVSHKYSKDSGISIDDQLDRAKRYAASILPEHDIVSIFDEGISAWSKGFAGRPGGRKITEDARRGDQIICYSIDRLCRNLRDFCNITHHFEQVGVGIHYLTNQINTATSSGKLQANVLAAMAQYASDLTSERTKEALLIKKLKESGDSKIKPKSKWIKSEFGLVLPESVGRKTGTIRMYERVSTQPQYISGLGLAWQEKANTEYAKELSSQLGCQIGERYSDPAISAFSIPFMERPAGKQLIEDLQPGDDVVIYRLDRGWRNTLDAMKTIKVIQDKGAYVHFVCERIRTDTGEGKEWISLMASIAQLESQMRSNRIKEAMARCRVEGRPTASPRFGFRTQNLPGRRKKLAVDEKKTLRAAQIWVLKNEIGLSSTQVESMVLAIEARERGRPANLAMHRRICTDVKLKKTEILREMIGESLWEKWVQKARESLSKPFRKGHLRLIRDWEWTYGPVVP